MKWFTDRVGLTTAEEETVTTEENTKTAPSKAIIRAKIAGKIRTVKEITEDDLETLTTEDYSTPINKKNGFTLLHRAVFNKNTQAIRMIMRHSANVPPFGLFPNTEYATALHLAANSNDATSIRTIIEEGIALQSRNSSLTPQQKRDNIIETRDSKNQTPFIAAVFSGSENAINEMLKNGGVNYAYTCKDESGRKKYYCAFSSAAQSMKPQVFYDAFAKCNENLNTKDYNGKNCLDYALEFQNPEAIKYLSQHPHILHLDNLQALVAAKTELTRSGENPEFQAVVSAAVDLLATKNKEETLPALVDRPELHLGTPVEFEVPNEVTTTVEFEVSNEEEKSSELKDDLDKTSELNEDSELNAPRSRSIIAGIIDENREQNIATRKAEREAAFNLWKKANPDAAKTADRAREEKIAAIEKAKMNERDLGVVDRKGLADNIDAAREEKSSKLKETGQRNWGARLKSTGTKYDKDGNIIKPSAQR